MFVAGEYDWSVHPGLKNLTDHFPEEWYWRPAVIASYSAGRFAGARGVGMARDPVQDGMVVVSSLLAVGGIGDAFDEGGTPAGNDGAALVRALPRFAADLA